MDDEINVIHVGPYIVTAKTSELKQWEEERKAHPEWNIYQILQSLAIIKGIW